MRILDKLFKFSIYAIFFLMPLVFSENLFLGFDTPKVFVFRLFFYLAAASFLLKVFVERKIHVPGIFRNKTFLILSGLLVFVFVISTILSVSPELSFFGKYNKQAGLFSFLHYYLFFILLLFGFGKEDFKKALVAALCGLGLSLLYGVSQFFGFYIGDFNIDTFLGRIFSTFGHPNTFGLYVLILFFPVLGAIVICYKRKKWVLMALCVLLICLSVFDLVISKGRASILGVVAGLFVFIVLAGIYFHKRKVVVLSFIVPVLLISSVVFANIFGWPGRLVLSGENLRAVETRLVMWPKTVDLVFEKPVFGHGLDTFEQSFGPHMDNRLLLLESISNVPDRAHNVILQWASDLGIFGLFVILISFLWIMYIGFPRRRMKLEDALFACAILSSLIGVFVADQFGFSTHIHFVFIAFFVAWLLRIVDESVYVRNFNKTISALLVCALVLLSGFNVRYLLADYYFNSGFIDLGRGDFYNSFQKMYKADSFFPYQNFYKLYVAKSYLNLGTVSYPEEKSEILDAARSAILANLKFSSGQSGFDHLVLAQIYSENGDYKSAASEFEIVKKSLPLFPEVYLNMGKFYLKQKMFSEAISAFEYYLSICPDYWKNGTDYNKHRIFYKEQPFFNKVFGYLVEAYEGLGDGERVKYYGKF